VKINNGKYDATGSLRNGLVKEYFKEGDSG
jgi:hypothetical protein